MKTLVQNIHPLLNEVRMVMENTPNRTALIGKTGESHSYGDLAEYVNHIRKVLQEKGVKKGTRVLVAVPMTVELYAILLALFSLGGIAVFLDPWMKGKQMARIIRDVKPELLIISSRLKWLAYLLPATWRIKQWWGVKKVERLAGKWEIDPVEDKDIALITYTSGTSGNPKGADRTFGFLAAQMRALDPHLRSENIETDYTNFPIVGLADLGVGNAVAIPTINLMKIHEANPQEILYSLQKTQASRLIVSPSLLKRAITGLKNANQKTNLQTVFTGGAPIPFSLIETCLEQFPKVNFEAIFGSTEAEPIALTTFDEMKVHMDDPLKGVFVGEPESITTCKFIKAFDRSIDAEMLEEMICEDGEVGELIVYGDHVNKSYFENPEAFLKNKIEDLDQVIWHRTGDMGYFDNRNIYLVGRLHRKMTHQGRALYPFPMEFYLERKLNLPDVGYVQAKSGEFRLYIGGEAKVHEEEIRNAFQKCNYPIDKIICIPKALPRDPRHRSKLDIHRLLAYK